MESVSLPVDGKVIIQLSDSSKSKKILTIETVDQIRESCNGSENVSFEKNVRQPAYHFPEVTLCASNVVIPSLEICTASALDNDSPKTSSESQLIVDDFYSESTACSLLFSTIDDTKSPMNPTSQVKNINKHKHHCKRYKIDNTTDIDDMKMSVLNGENNFVAMQDTRLQTSKEALNCGVQIYQRKRNSKSRLANLDELRKVVGVAKSEVTTDKMDLRRFNITKKIMLNKNIHFTKNEEYDIHYRAQQYIKNVQPDFKYVIANSESRDLQEWKKKYPSKNKRRRHLSVKDNKIFVSSIDSSGPEYETFVTLGNGVTLLRPPTKLVEMVAETISDSPDRLLQVHHVYSIIMAQYPYFQYMKPEYLTSWRSSIRHALYQKWFHKVVFSIDLINAKGCYWGLNTSSSPKEWKLPSLKNVTPNEWKLPPLKNNTPMEWKPTAFNNNIHKQWKQLQLKSYHKEIPVSTTINKTDTNEILQMDPTQLNKQEIQQDTRQDEKKKVVPNNVPLDVEQYLAENNEYKCPTLHTDDLDILLNTDTMYCTEALKVSQSNGHEQDSLQDVSELNTMSIADSIYSDNYSSDKSLFSMLQTDSLLWSPNKHSSISYLESEEFHT